MRRLSWPRVESDGRFSVIKSCTSIPRLVTQWPMNVKCVDNAATHTSTLLQHVETCPTRYHASSHVSTGLLSKDGCHTRVLRLQNLFRNEPNATEPAQALLPLYKRRMRTVNKGMQTITLNLVFGASPEVLGTIRCTKVVRRKRNNDGITLCVPIGIGQIPASRTCFATNYLMII
jgi:hypothetical protein